MIKKNSAIIFGLLLLSFFLVGVVNASGGTCTPQDYDCGWKDINDFVESSSGDTGYSRSNGYWYIQSDKGGGILEIKTPNLPFSGEYNFGFKYGIGNGGSDLDTEDFEVECGGVTHDFPDSVLINDPQILKGVVSCDFSQGENTIKFKSNGIGSVNLYEFRIAGQKTCPQNYICGDGILNQSLGEQCDDGNTASGDGCSSTCQIETSGPVCGNDVIETGEQCDDGNNVNGDGCSSICEKEDDNKRRGGMKELAEFCSPNWECGGWSECSNGVMTRNCFDTNYCDVQYNKPLEQTGCYELSKVYEEETNNNFVWFLTGIVIFLILVIVLVNLLRVK